MVELPARDGPLTADSPRDYPAGRAIGQEASVGYDAFISYSHAKDKPIATALQSVVQKLGKAWYHRRALRVFRDDTSPSATPHLWPSIEQALSQSRFLILLASPEAAASRWVGQEVAYWLDHNNTETVLIALTDGQLDWDEATDDFRWSEATPLPRALENRFANEPRWIDLRPYRDDRVPKGVEFMGLAADFASAIRGIPKEDLLSEEVRQQRRFRTLAWTVGTALFALLVLAGWEWRAAERQRAVAEAQTKVAKDQTKEAQNQRNEAQLQRDKARAQLLAIEARQAAESGDPDDIERAGALALESIEIARNNKRPAEADAVEAARSALIHLPLAVLSQGSPVLSLAVLGDGRLASGGFDSKIRIWPKDFAGAPEVLPQGGNVWSLAVLGDGRLASGGDDGKIRIWPKDFAGAPEVLSQGSEVSSLAVLGDGRLASSGIDGKILIWPKNFAGAPRVLSQGYFPLLAAQGNFPLLAALGDGRLAGSGEDDKIRIWPKDFAGAPEELPGSRVRSRAVLGDGRLASSGEDGKIRIWPKDFAGAPEELPGSRVTSVQETPPKPPPVRTLAVLGDGRLASGDQDGKVRIWPNDFAGAPRVLSQGSLASRGSFLAALGDGRLASGGTDGQIRIWPKDFAGAPEVLSQGSSVSSLTAARPGSGCCTALAVLRDGRLASSGNNGIRIWPKDFAGAPEVLSQGGEDTTLAVVGDGRLASGGFASNIMIWPKDSSGAPEELPGSSVSSLAVLRDGRLAGGGFDGKIRIRPKDFAGAPEVLSQGSSVSSLAVLGDGRLASGGTDGKIRIWPKDFAGAPEELPQGSWVLSLAVLGDGRLASGGEDGKIRIWPKDFAGAPEVLSQGSLVSSLAVLRDGRLASGGEDGKIKIWLVDEQELVAALCLRAGRNLTKDEWAQYIGSDILRQPSCRNLPSNWRTPDA